VDAVQTMRLLAIVEACRIPEVVEHLVVGLWQLLRNPKVGAN
jgi:hypothetical protein